MVIAPSSTVEVDWKFSVSNYGGDSIVEIRAFNPFHDFMENVIVQYHLQL